MTHSRPLTLAITVLPAEATHGIHPPGPRPARSVARRRRVIRALPVTGRAARSAKLPDRSDYYDPRMIWEDAEWQ